MDFKKELIDAIKIEGVSAEEIESAIMSSDGKNGDYCLPCFKFAKALKCAPQQIAVSLRDSLVLPAAFSRAEALGGYLNFFLDRTSAAEKILTEALSRKAHDKKGKTICIDYSSVNIAKPFHIGHLMTTVIGGALYRIFEYLGYNVVGINHLGDWGTQFGKLIAAYLHWGKDKPLTMDSLLELYVKFHTEAEKDESLNDEGRAWFKKIEEGDAFALNIFNTFKEITLKEVGEVYDRLGVSFDSYNGESFYNDKMTPVIERLEEKGLLVESEGARVVPLDEYDMPPCLIVKKDGASLYATRDLAAAIYRKNTYDFDKSLYIVAYQQNLHFKQFFKVLELMGYDWADKCVHVPFGMVSLEGKALSTRSGNVVKLKDVLDTAVQKTEEIMAEKNACEIDRKRIAEEVGVGAVIFWALSTSRIKDVSFSYDRALNFDGETGPYLQYTHARCCSVLEKVNVEGKPDASLLTDELSFDIIRLLAAFDDTVMQAAVKYEPSLLARYLIDLAKGYNRFYLERRIVGQEDRVCLARAKLTEAVRDTIGKGLNLLLVKAPQKM